MFDWTRSGSMWPYSMSNVRRLESLLLAGERAVHEFAEGAARVFRFVEDFVHLVNDGHFDAVAKRELMRGAAGGNAFGDHGHAGEDFLERSPLTELGADIAIAGEIAGGGEDEIAETGESAESARFSAEMDGETGDFGEAASDERSDAVAAEPEAVADAGADGDYVFESGSEFHADDVGTGVEAQGIGGKSVLNVFGDPALLAGDDDRSWFAGRDFFSEGRAGEDGDGGTIERFGSERGHAAEALLFDAFGGADDVSVGRQKGARAFENLAQMLGGHDGEQEIGRRGDLRDFGGNSDVFRKTEAGEIAGVFAAGVDFCGAAGVTGPDLNGFETWREGDGKSGAPTACAED